MAGSELSHRNQRSAAIDPTRTGFAEGLRARQSLLWSALVGLVAFACYRATLLPGLDFGDTASFQTGVGSLTLTPRQAYPLYYALGNAFVWLVPGEPAHAMNFASAIYGALAVAAASWVAIELAGSVIAGIAAGLFLGFSYTFWTQAIIAEVYTLHLLIVGLCLAALLWWAKTGSTKRGTAPFSAPEKGAVPLFDRVRERPLARLALLYAVYAIGFGNHLSLILFLPAFAVFILLHRKVGPADPLRPTLLAMAVGIAALGALQYVWNFRGLWAQDPPPATLSEALSKFWFDVTKADWRQTLVATVSQAGLENRPAMYWFDLRQQFGVPGILLAIAGFFFIAVRRPRIGILLFLCYLANLVFAWNYNVGDVHVFFLPSHYIVALCAGAGIAALIRVPAVSPQPSALRPFTQGLGYAFATFCLAYVLWRGYDTFPAVDRSWDHRPTRVMEQLTDGRAVFGVDTNWQVQNAVEYYVRTDNPAVLWFTTDGLGWLSGGLSPYDVARRVQAFVAANEDAGRWVVVTFRAVTKLFSLGYPHGSGDTQSFLQRDSVSAVLQTADSLPSGTVYALGILRPDPEFPFDARVFASIWTQLSGGSSPLPPLQNYMIAIGVVGREPSLLQIGERPFRTHVRIGSNDFDVRMESWLPTDTIRRAGFGHVIVGHRHALTLERGISFAWFDQDGNPSAPTYESGIFGIVPRFELTRLQRYR